MCIKKFEAIFLLPIAYCLLPIVFISCNKEEPIPSYIHIDRIDFSTVSGQGSSKEPKIIDAWVYIDDISVGAFEMPFTAPVLFEGTHTIKVFPGIKENGIAETRITYPFYSQFSQDINLTAKTITTAIPNTTYSSAADFTWMEDFEGASPNICDTSNSDTVMFLVTSGAYEGAQSGGVVLTSGTIYMGVSCNKYVLPQNGSPVFLEFHYNCNTEFKVGVIGYTSNNLVDVQTTALTLNPTDGWNKIYVNLSDEVTTATNSTKFAIFFYMQKDSELSSSHFYVDNIKLIN